MARVRIADPDIVSMLFFQRQHECEELDADDALQVVRGLREKANYLEKACIEAKWPAEQIRKDAGYPLSDLQVNFVQRARYRGFEVDLHYRANRRNHEKVPAVHDKNREYERVAGHEFCWYDDTKNGRVFYAPW